MLTTDPSRINVTFPLVSSPGEAPVFGEPIIYGTHQQLAGLFRQTRLTRLPRPVSKRAAPARRPDLLTTRAAAEYLGVSPRTLEDWRTKADATGVVQGPKVTRSGGRVFYRIADLDAFQAAETHLTAGQVRLKQQRRKVRRVTSQST